MATFERKDIKNTPFSAMHNVDTERWVISLGNNQITDQEFTDFESLEMYVRGLEEIPWTLIFNATACFIDYLNNERKNTSTNTKNE